MVDTSSLITPEMRAELKRLEIRSRRSMSSDLVGVYRSAFRGSGIIYSDLREYQPGDDIKNIHWKASARSNKVYVKSYEEDRQLRIMLLVDISSSTIFGSNKSKHRKALEFTGLISLLAKNSRDAVGVCLFSDEVEEFIPPAANRSQFQRIFMSLLKKRTLKPETNIKGALDFIMREGGKRSVIFVVSDFIDKDYENSLRVLSLKHDVVCVCVEDELDYKLPQAGLVEFSGAEDDVKRIIDTSSNSTQNWVSALQKNRLKELTKLTTRTGSDLMRFSDKPIESFHQLMQERMRRIH